MKGPSLAGPASWAAAPSSKVKPTQAPFAHREKYHVAANFLKAALPAGRPRRLV